LRLERDRSAAGRYLATRSCANDCVSTTTGACATVPVAGVTMAVSSRPTSIVWGRAPVVARASSVATVGVCSGGCSRRMESAAASDRCETRGADAGRAGMASGSGATPVVASGR